MTRSMLTFVFAASAIIASGVQASSISAFVPSADMGSGVFAAASPEPVVASPGPPNSFIAPSAGPPNGYTSGDNPGGAVPSPNYVNLSTTVTALHNPIEGVFGVSDLGFLGGAFAGLHEYFFRITVTNGTTVPFPIGPTFIELFPGTLGVGAVGTPNTDFFSNKLPVPTSTWNGVDLGSPAAWTPTRITYGGLLGGGGELAPGGVGTLTFSIDVPAGLGGTFGLRLVPNPEPTSLALAGAGFGVMGLVAGIRRRRKKTA